MRERERRNVTFDLDRTQASSRSSQLTVCALLRRLAYNALNKKRHKNKSILSQFKFLTANFRIEISERKNYNIGYIDSLIS